MPGCGGCGSGGRVILSTLTHLHVFFQRKRLFLHDGSECSVFCFCVEALGFFFLSPPECYGFWNAIPNNLTVACALVSLFVFVLNNVCGWKKGNNIHFFEKWMFCFHYYLSQLHHYLSQLHH